MKKSSAVGVRYASALFSLAQERGLREAVAADLKSLSAMLAESADLRELIHSPLLARKDQESAILTLAKKADFADLSIKFLGTLATERRLAALEDIISAYQDLLSAAKDERFVEVTSAAPLRPGQIEALRTALAGKLGGIIHLTLAIDASLLGGLVVKYGSKMIDSSLKTKLERLGFMMKGTV